jgi:hypothetical protein
MDIEMKLKFELEDVDGKHSSEFVVDDMESWHELVIKFTDFLSARYGYSMSHNVLFVTDYPFGRIKEQYVTPNEVELVMRNRQRNDAIDSLWGDDE